MRLFFGQLNTDPLAQEMRKQFLKGLPMPIIVSLTDIKGPVLGAEVMAEVEHPDGEGGSVAALRRRQPRRRQRR